MKHKTKHLLKLAMLIFIASFLMTNCEKDDDFIKEEPSTKQKAPSKYLQPVIVFENEINQNETLKQALNKLKNKGAKEENNTASKLILNDTLNIAIEDSSAKYLETPDGNYHSYTFVAFDYDHPQGIQNVVLSLRPDGTYKEILMRYDLNESETELFRNNEPLDLEGKVSFAVLGDNSFAGDLFSKETANDPCIDFNYDGGSDCIAGGNHSYADGAYSSTNPDGCQAWGTWQGPHQGSVTSTSIDWDCVDAGSGSGYTPPNDNNPSNGPQSGAGGPNSQQDASSGYAPTPQQERESNFIKHLISNDNSDCFVSLPPNQQSEIFNFLENGLSIDIDGNVLNENPTQYNESDIEFAEQAALALCGDSELEFEGLEQLYLALENDCKATILVNLIDKDVELVNLITNKFFKSSDYNLQVAQEEITNPTIYAHTVPPTGMVFNSNTFTGIFYDTGNMINSTDLSFVMTTAHEFVHVHLFELFSSNQLLSNYPTYTTLNSSMINYKSNPTPANHTTMVNEMHSVYNDFLIMITDVVFKYASDNNIEGATYEYCKKITVGSHQNTATYLNLSQDDKDEYAEIATNEHLGDNNAKGTKCNE